MKATSLGHSVELEATGATNFELTAPSVDRKPNRDLAYTTLSPRYLRKRQAAAYLGICQRTLTALMQRRAIPYIKVTRGIALFDATDLDRALQRYRVKPVGEEVRK